MRVSTFHLLTLISVAAAIQLPDLQPFLTAIPNILADYIPQTLQNNTIHDLLKRQDSTGCPTGFDSCANLGAPQLCCLSNAVCSADQGGNVACCPSGAACTGRITGYITSGTINTDGVVVGGGAFTTSDNGVLAGSSASTTSFQFYSSTTTNNGGLVAATTQTAATVDGQTTGNGFIVAGSSTVATPGAGVKRADIPYVIKVITYIFDVLLL